VTRSPVEVPPASDWTEPGAYAVAPGVFRIPLPLPHDGLRAVNAYAVVTGNEVAIIDGGWALADSEALLERARGQLGHDLGAVTGFYVTHAHRDHYTQAVAVRRRLGTRVALGVHEQPNLRRLQDLTSPRSPSWRRWSARAPATSPRGSRQNAPGGRPPTATGRIPMTGWPTSRPSSCRAVRSP
jgi:glyoxylase-like metal-dependent hydrolase (beta-lactamase superfamily II)